MIGIIGKKLGMTQIFNEQGQQIPVTVIEAEPNPVTKVVDKATSGFASVELGYGRQKSARASAKGERDPRGSRASKAEVGHAAKAGLDYAPRVLRSFRLDDAPGKDPEIPSLAVGATVDVEIKVE
jgi:large subunit ribosomal protein L3